MQNLMDYGSDDSDNEEESNECLEKEAKVIETNPNSDKSISKTAYNELGSNQDLQKINFGTLPKLTQKNKQTIIPYPSLAGFEDLKEEEENNKQAKSMPSKKGSGLIGFLPPPNNSVIGTKTNLMVPHVLTKKPVTVQSTISKLTKTEPLSKTKIAPVADFKAISISSDSEDDDDQSSSGTDFFSLSAPTMIPQELLPAESSIATDNEVESYEEFVKADKVLVSNVLNLSKEEIRLKNEVEVGPKLPIPEQEYSIDNEGNLAFDDKAIEYLCGKRGVKRKNEFDNVEILDVNGDDIKPDEREWLVKALTEEPVARPVSINAGPSGQSKKKHQITYLAHQAKAMELELKNQWAQNKASRQQTRSKYGF